MSISRICTINKRLTGTKGLTTGNACQVGPTKAPAISGPDVLGCTSYGGCRRGEYRLTESFCGVKRFCKQSVGAGGNIICANAGVYWILSPNSSQVSRNWYGVMSDAPLRAQQDSGCTGWFVPTDNQFVNPGVNCRDYWDAYQCTCGYWTSSEVDAGRAWRRYMPNGARPYVNFAGSKTYIRCGRAFRCVSY
jgi:hypothetical protein